MGVFCLLYGQHLTRVVCLRVNINNFLFLFLRSAAKFYRKAEHESTAGKMLTVCCRICLKNTHFKQMLSLFDTYKGFVIRDALLELFQIKVRREMVTPCSKLPRCELSIPCCATLHRSCRPKCYLQSAMHVWQRCALCETSEKSSLPRKANIKKFLGRHGAVM